MGQMLMGMGGGGLTVTVVPTTRSANRTGAGVVTTATVVATATGGSGSYTYAWTRNPGNSQRITATAPTNGTTAFTVTIALGESLQDDFTCTATDTVTGATGFFSPTTAILTES